MDKIRVLQLELDYKIGGIETFIYNLYKGIDRSKVQFDVLTRRDAPARGEELEQLGANVIKIHSYNHPFAYCKDLKTIFSKEYDIIHINKNSAAIIITFYLAKKYSDSVIVAHSHNTNPTKGSLSGLLHKINRGYLTRTADYRLACSKDAGLWMFGKNVPFQIINNAIDTERYRYNKQTRDSVRKRLGIENKWVIGHVGRFEAQKNHEFLIDIFYQISKLKSDATLMLIGEGTLENEVRGKVKNLGLEDKVIFLGRQEDTSQFYQAMDVFIFPSLFEGLSIASIEAQAAGLKSFNSDGVSKDVKITDLVEFLPLSDGAENWAERIVRDGYNYPRLDTSEQIKAAGYDIYEESAKMLDFYKKIINGK